MEKEIKLLRLRDGYSKTSIPPDIVDFERATTDLVWACETYYRLLIQLLYLFVGGLWTVSKSSFTLLKMYPQEVQG